MTKPSRFEALLALFGPVVLCAALCAIAWPFRNAPRLHLEPYLNAPSASGLLGAWTQGWIEALPLAAVFALALGAVLVGLGIGRLGARHGRAHTARAGLFCMAALGALPAIRATLVLRGGEVWPLLMLLLGAALWLLTASQRPLRYAGMGLAVLAAAVHPLAAPLAAGLLAWAAWTGDRLDRAAPLAALVLSLFLAALGPGLDPSSDRPGVIGLAAPVAASVGEHRAELGLAHAVALPALLVRSEARHVFPTGAEALGSEWPLQAGALAWAVLLILGIALAGWKPACSALGLAFCAAWLTPFLCAGWIPGDLGPALFAGLPVLALVPFIGRRLEGLVLWRDALLGGALGLALIGGLASHATRPFTPAEVLRERRTALGLPRQRFEDRLRDLDVHAERDPVRLLLYGLDLSLIAPGDSSVMQVVTALRHRMGDRPLPALDPIALQDLSTQLQARAQGRSAPPPVGARPEEAALITELDRKGLEVRIQELYRSSRDREAIDQWYPAIPIELRDQLLPELTRLAFTRWSTPRLESLAATLEILCSDVATIATVVGDAHLAIPLREHIVIHREVRGVRADPTAVQLGVDLADVGRFEEALARLDAALPAFPSNEVVAVIGRAARGRAKAALGDERGALTDYEQAWSAFAVRQRPLVELIPNVRREHWLMIELLYRRAEAIRRLDPPLWESARGEFTRALERAIAFGPRRVPGLYFEALQHRDEGRIAEARQRLQELRGLRPRSALERGDGNDGRHDHLRWRREALELELALTPAEEGALRTEIAAELAELSAPR